MSHPGWRASYTDAPKRLTILVSRYGHCLIDRLWRCDAVELEDRILVDGARAVVFE